MEINYLKKADIDLRKWDQTIAAHSRGLPYGFSWYLDSVTKGKWDALMANDYKYVMPLPWNGRLFGFKQIYQPLLSQQLGVFGPNLSTEMAVRFIQFIPDTFRKINISFNQLFDDSADQILSGELSQKKNLVLSLTEDYEKIFRGYNSSTRNRVKRDKTTYEITRSKDIPELVRFYKNYLSSVVKFSSAEWQQVESTLFVISSQLDSALLVIKNEEGQPMGMGLFIITPERIIYLFGTSNEEGRKKYAMHLLIDHLIEAHAGSGKIFDFEGSSIKGIYNFFKSFGSVAEDFSTYQADHLPWLIQKVLAYR